MKKTAFIIPLLLWNVQLHAQEINFHTYADYGMEVGPNIQEIDFNRVGPIISGRGQYSLMLGDEGGVIPIIAVKYLDIFVEVIADEYLSNGSDNIPFTLEAAYANNKGEPLKAHAKPVNVAANAFTIRIPVLERQNLPPNPPPRPTTAATDMTVSPSNPLFEVVHLYLYGSIDVGDVSAGSYIGNVTINVSYE